MISNPIAVGLRIPMPRDRGQSIYTTPYTTAVPEKAETSLAARVLTLYS